MYVYYVSTLFWFLSPFPRAWPLSSLVISSWNKIKFKKKTATLGCYCYYYRMLSIYNCNLDTILKSIIKRQIPFLIGGTITGIIMTYYYGFLFTIIVNSAILYVISYFVRKYYYKSKGVNDQKYLIKYGLSKIKSRNKTVKAS